MATSNAVEHADSDQEKIETAKETVAYILSRREGRSEAISSEDLAERTPIESTTVRDLIPTIIEEYRLPIASCPNGYYRIADHDDFVDEIQQFESQREQATSRMEALAMAYYGESGVHH